MSTASPILATAPGVIDVLADLLNAEQTSILQFAQAAWPYLTRTTIKTKEPLRRMIRGSEARCRALADLIQGLGGSLCRRGLQPQEQYLAYLSQEFLLPKFVASAHLLISLYQAALDDVAGSAHQIADLLRRQAGDLISELALLESTMASK